MKSQVLRLKTTQVLTQLLPLRLSSPPRRALRIFRARRFPHPLDGLESAPGTLPAALFRSAL